LKPFDSNQIIQEIQTGGEGALRAMYPRYQAVFMKTLRGHWQHTFDEETLIEAYMEAIANFYIRVKTGKLTELTNTVDSYLIATGRNLLIKEAKQRGVHVPMDTIGDPPDLQNEDMNEEDKARMHSAFTRLGKTCQKLLTMSFFEGKSAEEVMTIMEYSNLNTLYAAKARCLRDLKKLF
jgi:DNA-directed RNA polymerase specialized sigma24 family protein